MTPAEVFDPPLSDSEAQERANLILYLERQGMPLEKAIEEGDLLIAIRRAWGHGPKETPA